MENQTSNAPIQDEIKLSDYIRIVLQYRYLVVLVFAVVIALTIIYTARQPKIYSASARILLEDQKNQSDLLFLATPGVGTNALNNQIELMKS
ncbi:MAG TPA: Wzz/FepE/Etk N-terminal domain-containing protein, partial [Candidatus Cloacimonadota bacterium]|nr:Wzz/FepE/Etk N-terminal domain-containing protein [Candidatus Cloacimonadota bacterium]